MALDINKLTLGEVAKVEELSGRSITEVGEDKAPKGYSLAALAYVAKRREEMDFTWQDALELTFDEANEILGMTEGEDNEEAAKAAEAAAEVSGTKSAGKGKTS